LFRSGESGPIGVFKRAPPVPLFLPESPDAAFVEGASGYIRKAEQGDTAGKQDE
jgi:hypothetical protein